MIVLICNLPLYILVLFGSSDQEELIWNILFKLYNKKKNEILIVRGIEFVSIIY